MLLFSTSSLEFKIIYLTLIIIFMILLKKHCFAKVLNSASDCYI